MNDIEAMFNEILSTMRNNFTDTIDVEEKYEQAKALYLETIADAIDQNKEMIIQDFKA
jgi:hypothetical protein